jgi:alpha-1,3-glucan synthase
LTHRCPYRGRGRTPTQLPPGFLPAANLTENQDEYFLRDLPLNGLDAAAFHYSIYRSLTRFLGMDGNLQVAYDVDTNFITAWNEMFVTNDLLNPSTGAIDPKHMYGTSNFDVFRWPSLVDGEQRSVLATFITSLVMPGIPLVRMIKSLLYPLFILRNSYIMARSKASTCTTTVLQTIFTGNVSIPFYPPPRSSTVMLLGVSP